MAGVPSWVSGLFSFGVQDNGSAVAGAYPTVNFVGAGVSVAADSANSRFDVTITSSSSTGIAYTAKVATTANHPLSGTTAIDGISISAGDTILVWQQSSAAANGIYTAAAGAWARHTDFDTEAEFVPGFSVYVLEGNTYGDTRFAFTNDGVPATLGATALNFSPEQPYINTSLDLHSNTLVNASGIVAGASSLNASAILQADSTTKGFLPPRMTTTQRDAIASPATGLQIVNTTNERPERYDGSEWVSYEVVPVVSIHYLNHSLSGLNMSDYTVGEGDIVLLRSQTAAAENGPWIASSGAWSRLPPWDTAAGFRNGQVFISSGITTGTAGAAGAVIVDAVPTTLGTDPITFRSLYRPWTTETSINFGVPIEAETLTLAGPAAASGMLMDLGVTGAIELPRASTTTRNTWSPSLAWLFWNTTTNQPEWRNSSGAWDPRFSTLRVGTTGTQVAVLDIESTAAASSPLVHVENSTTGADFDIGGGSSVPSHSARAGTVWVRSSTNNSSIYVNTSATSPGTTWTQLSAATATDLPTGYVSGGEISWVNGTTVRIAPGTCRDEADGDNIVWTSNLDAVITTSGAGGLDTGSEAASTWYDLYVIDNGSTPAALLVAQFGTPTMPSGYTVRRRLGIVQNDSGSDFAKFFCLGNARRRWYQNDGDESQILSAGAATTPTGVDATGAAPPPASGERRLINVTYKASNSTGNLTIYAGTNYWIFRVDMQTTALAGVIPFMLPDDGNVDYYFSAASGSCTLNVREFEDLV
ncbi:MAG: hypothetical protein ACWGPR_08490 [Candidatus Deferrimicrobiaceae bacterium]